MHINAIDSYCNVNCRNNINPNFKSLIKDKTASSIINNMSEDDIKEFNKIKKRLSKTKFWDMKISSIGKKFQEFKFHFISKNDKNKIITDGIYPYDKQGNTIRFYTIVYGAENASSNTIGTLSFKTKKKADELYDSYQQNALYMRNREYNITPLESLKMKEVELKMLEEASKKAEEGTKLTQVNTKIHLKKSTGNKLDFNEE